MLKHSIQVLTAAALGLVLVSCSSHAPKDSRSASAKGSISGPSDFKQSRNDGAPWWDVDVSQIPDAVPMPHVGNYKAAPYTVLGSRYFPIQDANKTLPLPSYVKVTNLENGRSVTLRVNDRGPFYSDRVIDLSFAAAQKLGYAEKGVARVNVEGIDPHEWWAARGKKVPGQGGAMVLAQQQIQPTQVQSERQVFEQYTPPAKQHAGAVSPAEIRSTNTPVAADSLYLQVGAFANPDAAQLLRDKLSALTSAPVFINSVVRNEQVLHRVRMGPVLNQDEADDLRDRIRLANLGQPSLVAAD